MNAALAGAQEAHREQERPGRREARQPDHDRRLEATRGIREDLAGAVLWPLAAVPKQGEVDLRPGERLGLAAATNLEVLLPIGEDQVLSTLLEGVRAAYAVGDRCGEPNGLPRRTLPHLGDPQRDRGLSPAIAHDGEHRTLDHLSIGRLLLELHDLPGEHGIRAGYRLPGPRFRAALDRAHAGR